MPEISDEKITAACYPPKTLYDNWCEHANDLGMSTSRFVIRMVEAGRKNISMDDVPSESIRNLRQERDELDREVERQKERIRDLEQQLKRTSRTDIVEVIEDNPGITTAEIMQHVADTVPGRVASHLDVLEGTVVEVREDGYYPLENGTEGSPGSEEV